MRAHGWPEGVEVECVDTGLDTPTGGRIARVGPLLEGRSFCATYADGVADIDLGRLIELSPRPRRTGDYDRGAATAPVRRGGARTATARVLGFQEKPRAEHWVNGGFFCFEPGALDYMGPDSVLEREPLERLAADGQLHAYRHEGFWDCMDTYKDAALLNDLWSRDEAPWRVWT